MNYRDATGGDCAHTGPSPAPFSTTSLLAKAIRTTGHCHAIGIQLEAAFRLPLDGDAVRKGVPKIEVDGAVIGVVTRSKWRGTMDRTSISPGI